MNEEEDIEYGWDIFKRLEMAEKAYEQVQERTNELQKEIEGVKPTLESVVSVLVETTRTLRDTMPMLRDASILARHSYVVVFLLMATSSPGEARARKDSLVGALRRGGLSEGKLVDIERDLLEICDWAEKLQR
jgi:hypothetical protein